MSYSETEAAVKKMFGLSEDESRESESELRFRAGRHGLSIEATIDTYELLTKADVVDFEPEWTAILDKYYENEDAPCLSDRDGIKEFKKWLQPFVIGNIEISRPFASYNAENLLSTDLMTINIEVGEWEFETDANGVYIEDGRSLLEAQLGLTPPDETDCVFVALAWHYGAASSDWFAFSNDGNYIPFADATIAPNNNKVTPQTAGLKYPEFCERFGLKPTKTNAASHAAWEQFKKDNPTAYDFGEFCKANALTGFNWQPSQKDFDGKGFLLNSSVMAWTFYRDGAKTYNDVVHEFWASPERTEEEGLYGVDLLVTVRKWYEHMAAHRATYDYEYFCQWMGIDATQTSKSGYKYSLFKFEPEFWAQVCYDSHASAYPRTFEDFCANNDLPMNELSWAIGEYKKYRRRGELPALYWDSQGSAAHWYSENGLPQLDEYAATNDESLKGDGKHVYVDPDNNGYCPVTGVLLELYA